MVTDLFILRTFGRSLIFFSFIFFHCVRNFIRQVFHVINMTVIGHVFLSYYYTVIVATFSHMGGLAEIRNG